MVEFGQRLLDDLCEGIDFSGAQYVEDQAANGFDMTRCCLFDGSAALRCDHNEGAAAVLGTLHALHQAPPRHASHVMGDSAALPLQEPGQVGNPYPAFRAIGEVNQDLEVWHREAGIVM